MPIKIYQLDAFAEKVFSGNPAAVCPLDSWLEDHVLQAIAAENNLAETAFYVKNGENFSIRWFTPTTEVKLCGHATLASAKVLFDFEKYPGEIIRFASKSGQLTVSRKEDVLTLDFPATDLVATEIPANCKAVFGHTPVAAHQGGGFALLTFDSEETIRNMQPDLRLLSREIENSVVIVTSTASATDFVCRVFAPKIGIDEDPATGAAFTLLLPYWSKQLKKDEMTALQLSQRVGTFTGRYRGERVDISGKVFLYMKGEIAL